MAEWVVTEDIECFGKVATVQGNATNIKTINDYIIENATEKYAYLKPGKVWLDFSHTKVCNIKHNANNANVTIVENSENPLSVDLIAIKFIASGSSLSCDFGSKTVVNNR